MYGPDNKERVIVTKNLPGERWKELLVASGCRVEVCRSKDTILSNATIKKLLGAGKTAGVLGQLTEVSPLLPQLFGQVAWWCALRCRRHEKHR